MEAKQARTANVAVTTGATVVKRHLPERCWAFIVAFLVGHVTIDPKSVERWHRNMVLRILETYTSSHANPNKIFFSGLWAERPRRPLNLDIKRTIIEVMDCAMKSDSPISCCVTKKIDLPALYCADYPYDSYRISIRFGFLDPDDHRKLSTYLPTYTYDEIRRYQPNNFIADANVESTTTFDGDLHDIANLIKFLPGLTEFTCRNNGVKDLSSLNELLKWSRNLRVIDVSKNEIEDMDVLAETIATNTGLERLMAHENKIYKCQKFMNAAANNGTMKAFGIFNALKNDEDIEFFNKTGLYHR